MAIALTVKSATGETQHTPSVVSLATCDSGNVSTVISPGGSIAHGLHLAGIPWVIASQFPLWMKASTVAVSELFSGLLSGDDPRLVLYNLRHRLRTDCPSTHDWASIVAYATVPADFDEQLMRFHDRQMQDKLSVQLNWLDDLFGSNRDKATRLTETEKRDELETISQKTRAILASWRSDSPDDPEQRLKPATALRLGMSGANEKRLSIAYQVADKNEDALNARKASRDFYCLAIEADPTSTWTLTQYLSMNAVLALSGEQGRTPFAISPEDWWFIATRLATSEAVTPRGAFALTDLVELGLLGSIYAQPFDQEQTLEQIGDYIEEILQLEHNDPIPKIALLRQLQRYSDFWPHEKWNELVKKAINYLRPTT